jgi:hypothetical protein
VIYRIEKERYSDDTINENQPAPSRGFKFFTTALLVNFPTLPSPFFSAIPLVLSVKSWPSCDPAAGSQQDIFMASSKDFIIGVQSKKPPAFKIKTFFDSFSHGKTFPRKRAPASHGFEKAAFFNRR